MLNADLIGMLPCVCFCVSLWLPVCCVVCVCLFFVVVCVFCMYLLCGYYRALQSPPVLTTIDILHTISHLHPSHTHTTHQHPQHSHLPPLGFHTFDYARHFLSCCSRVLGLEHQPRKGSIILEYYGRNVGIKIMPTGVKPQQYLDMLANDPDTKWRRGELMAKVCVWLWRGGDWVL